MLPLITHTKMSTTFLLALLFGFLTTPSLCCSGPFNISFSSFDASSCNDGGDLICTGSANATNGTMNVTPVFPPGATPLINQVGRVLYRHPVVGWPASFCTSFTIKIVKDMSNSTTGAGDGMAFLLAQDASPSPHDSYGSYMGIFNKSTEGVLHQLAIEFDTYKNEDEPDGNHVGIDTNSIKHPVAIKSLTAAGIDLKSGRPITFQIQYDGWTKNLQISVAYDGDPLISFLNQTIKLKGTVPSWVYAGFSAATGPFTETHQILSWNFTSIQLPPESLGKEDNWVVAAVIIAIPVFVMAIMAASVVGFVIRARRRRKQRSDARKEDIEVLIAASNGPKLFGYKQLLKATGKFSNENLLGSGGFGSVYKGILSNPHHMTIAVKKVSSTSKQGEKEYLAEICTIGRLRHRNLLQLQGWCHERDQLLLVYDYMPNGSLDGFIGKGKLFLDWTTRYKILMGLASALVYLHEECGVPVVHRDVKPNNVMLDSDFNAHLGDFGLARLLQNESSVTTMIAGTPGYLAPEVSFIGRATTESDVYSFGMVVLELVCGKRSRGIMDENSLVDSVWELYQKGELLNCVDRGLEGKYPEEEVRRCLVVGLACLHPDYIFRPRMRKVVQVFINPEEPLMNLPECRPTLISLSFNSSSASTTTTFDANTAPGGSFRQAMPDETTVDYEL